MKVLVDNKYLEKIKKSQSLDSGKEGKCYLDKNNKVIKIFHKKTMFRKIYFDNINHNQIAFPIDLFYDKDNCILGYTMNYLNGKNLLNGFSKDLDLNELKSVYLKTRLMILKLKNIYMDDNCLENMLYDYESKKINLIDTSRWYEKLDGELDSINDFNWQMINSLLRNIDWKSFKLNRDKELYNMFLTYKYTKDIPSLFMEFLSELENKVSEYKGEKVKTIKDLSI